ncbi:MAG: ccmI [Rhodospirillales bacterium]|jgi:cytochrome c-type biogenesis protein CcmH|nr:ccmI [Rhodospirillales bacterium]MDB5382503.1 ccmI [Rhodospirillales bacterium]
MTWLLILGLAVLALAPLALALLRPARTRGRVEADRALYTAQRAEIDRELAEGRMDEAAHRGALLEVQRRLLAAPSEETAAARPSAMRPLLAALTLVPLLSMAVYLVGGVPEMPSAPYIERRVQLAQEEALFTTLRDRLARMPADSAELRQGLVLLGNAESGRGRFAQAAEAWTQALAIRFDAGLAADVAEIEIERGQVAAAARVLQRALTESPADPRLRFLGGLVAARSGQPEVARASWQRLLADAPPDAPWRGAVERQLQALP